MELGLLMQPSNQSAPLGDQVKAATLRFRNKFGLGWPNVCHVHPSLLPGNAHDCSVVVLDGEDGCVVQVIASPYIQPGQLYIGQDDEL